MSGRHGTGPWLGALPLLSGTLRFQPVTIKGEGRVHR